MHPIIISAGWFNIYSFGLMLALSFMVGIYISARRAKRFGVDPQAILDLSVYLILAGVLGSRILYVMFHLDEYHSLVDIFALWEGGATLYGGFLLAIFAAAFFAKKKNIDFLLIADILSPALALGIMLTRVGCFMSGCCFGKPTDQPWGLHFPYGSYVYYSQIHTNPDRNRDTPHLALPNEYFGYENDQGEYIFGLKPLNRLTPEQRDLVTHGTYQCLPVHQK